MLNPTASKKEGADISMEVNKGSKIAHKPISK
jgi:hypothetical protein